MKTDIQNKIMAFARLTQQYKLEIYYLKRTLAKTIFLLSYRNTFLWSPFKTIYFQLPLEILF